MGHLIGHCSFDWLGKLKQCCFGGNCHHSVGFIIIYLLLAFTSLSSHSVADHKTLCQNSKAAPQTYKNMKV